MFLWLSLLLPPHQDMVQLLRDSATAIGVLAVPGVCFMPDRRESCQLRLSFSLIAESSIPEAFRRIARLVDDAWLGFSGGEDEANRETILTSRPEPNLL